MVCLDCGGAGHYYEIDSAERLLRLAEAFPNQALDAVAIMGFADMSLGDRQPETRIRSAVGSCQHR